MRSIKELKKQYYTTFISIILLFITFTILMISCIVNKTAGNYPIVGVIIAVLIFLGGAVYSLRMLIIYLMDLKSVRANTFAEITGTVIHYKPNQGVDTGKQVDDHPTIQEIGSDKKIKLLVLKGTKINETYTFIYLKHSKIGVVKCQGLSMGRDN